MIVNRGDSSMPTFTSVLLNPAETNVPAVIGGLGLILFLTTAIVHMKLAIAVWGDAHALRQEKKYIYFASPELWCFVTLLTGLLGLSAYWLINRSTLRRD
jgi:hypothetical protein